MTKKTNSFQREEEGEGLLLSPILNTFIQPFPCPRPRSTQQIKQHPSATLLMLRPVLTLLVIAASAREASGTTLYGQHVFGKVGVGGDRRLTRFGKDDPWLNDEGRVMIRGPLVGKDGTLLFMGPGADGSTDCTVYQYSPSESNTTAIASCASMWRASLSTDLFAYDAAKNELYWAIDGNRQTDYSNQLYRLNLDGTSDRTGILSSDWTAALGRLLNVGQAKVSFTCRRQCRPSFWIKKLA